MGPVQSQPSGPNVRRSRPEFHRHLTKRAVAALDQRVRSVHLGALQFERIPPALMGRVSAAGLAISWCLMPLGGLLAGWAASSTGITTSLLIFAASYLAVTIAPALIPRWREMSTPVGAETSSSRANPTA